MIKYVCDICGKEVSHHEICDFIQVGQLSSGLTCIDVCTTCIWEIENDEDRVLKTMCKAIHEMIYEQK